MQILADTDPSPQLSEPYVPPNAEHFSCTFDYARGDFGMNQLERSINGMPRCPRAAGSYGNYFQGNRRTALDALIESAGVRQDRIIAMEKPNLQNAGAVLCEDHRGEKKQLVVWDPDFLAVLDRKAGTTWASVAILAHEMGHRLNNDTGQNPGVIPP